MLPIFPFRVRMFSLNRLKWMPINVHKPCSKQLGSPSVIGITTRKTHCSGQAENEYSKGHTLQFPLKGCRQALHCNCLQGSNTKAQHLAIVILSASLVGLKKTGNYSFLTTWQSLQVTLTLIKITTGIFANCSLSVGYHVDFYCPCRGLVLL